MIITTDTYALTQDEFAQLRHYSQCENPLLRSMASIALDPGSDPDDVCIWIAQNRQKIDTAAQDDPKISLALQLSLRFGISRKSGACTNDLGALYYGGTFVDQDYEQAAALYTLAMELGCAQAIINLGYIYEYGRTGEKNYAKAREYYTLAIALAASPEALYKLGDLYARGHGVDQNMAIAYQLWSRSYETSEPIELLAQSAFRIAQLVVNPECGVPGVEFDPMRALFLFQQAEIGLRIDIEQNGLTYYRKRLREAINGQAQARALLDS